MFSNEPNLRAVSLTFPLRSGTQGLYLYAAEQCGSHVPHGRGKWFTTVSNEQIYEAHSSDDSFNVFIYDSLLQCVGFTSSLFEADGDSIAQIVVADGGRFVVELESLS